MRTVVFEGALLIHGDCQEVDLGPLGIQYVVSDPPYGMGYKRSGISGNSISTTKKTFTRAIKGDDQPFDPSLWLRWPCVFTGAQWFYDRLPAGGMIHVWDKRGPYKPIDQADVDLVWCSVQAPPRKLECVWRGICRGAENTEKILHPTQKPVMVMAWMMELLGVPERATVLDPYMGSGSTGVACLRTGRPFVGIEILEEDFEIAVSRIGAEAAQGRLF